MRMKPSSWQVLLFAACLFATAGAQAQAGPTTLQAAAKHEADCRAGDGEACWVIGRWYRGGIRLPQDLGRARDLLGLGCARRNARACDELQEMNFESGVARQVAEAEAYYSARCDAGDANQCMRLANHFVEGKKVAADPAKARAYAGKACNLDAERGCFIAGVYAAQGQGGPVDGRAAARDLGRACRGGENTACMALQQIAQDGQLIPADGEMAISAAESACGRDFIDGCLAAATIAYRGAGKLAPDADRVRKNAARACELKDARGCLMLEEIARTGFMGRPVDLAAAAEASQKGCALGNLDACRLTVMHAAQTGDKDAIGKALLQACHGGVADACVDLAQMLASGDGVEKNTMAAGLYLIRALKIDPSHERAKALQAQLKD